MKRILVTGGSGFIGSHTCLSLLENKYEIFVIDSFVNSNPIALKMVSKIYNENTLELKKNIHLIKGDLRNIETINKIFEYAKNDGKPIVGVIHFAGLKAVGRSIEEPLKYWDFNLTSSINLFKSMQKNDCKTIVFSSSATVYEQNNLLINEKNTLNPSNPYGNTKYVIEKILLDIFNSSNNNWKIANLRYFNPIGAHYSGLIGEDSKDIPDNIFPYILQVASRNIPKLNIFGKDWSTHDGTCVRDYVHVMDLAEGHVCALDYLFKNQNQFINLNIGTGVGTSVLELVKIFEKSNNLRIPFTFAERREGDLPYVVADNTLAKQILKWTPKRNLEDMCIDGWRWKKLNPQGYQNL